MAVQLQNSRLRCPRDRTRLAFNPVDAGQNDTDGDYEERHFCVVCSYSEIVRPERDKPEGQARRSLAEILADVRAGNLAKRPVRPPAAFEIEEVP